MNSMMYISYAIILFEAICCTILFNALMPYKDYASRDKIWNLVEIILLSTTTAIIGVNMDQSVTKSLIICAVYFFDISLLRKSSIIMRFAVSVLLLGVILALDYFVFLLMQTLSSVSAEMITQIPQFFFFAAMLSKSILFLLVLTFRRIITKKNSLSYVGRKDWYSLVIQAVVSIVAIETIIELCKVQHTIPIMTVISAALLLYSNVVVFWLLESAAISGKTRSENALMQQQILIQGENIHSLSRSNNVQRQFAHDYKNQISTVYQLLSNGEHSKALELVMGISASLASTFYRIHTNHEIIDALLNQKDQQASEKGICMSVQTTDLSSLKTPYPLLVTVLGNAIDNAIEACEKICGPKNIRIKMLLEQGRMIFSVTNPVKKKVDIPHDNILMSTKNDTSIHGIGLKSIAMALDQCDGDYELYCNEETFQFTAFFRLV